MSNIRNLLPSYAFYDGAEFACDLSVYINPDLKNVNKMQDYVYRQLWNSFKNKDEYGYSANAEMSEDSFLHGQKIREIFNTNIQHLCLKIRPKYMLNVLLSDHLLIVSTTTYNRMRYLTGFMIIIIKQGRARIDLICTDSRLKYIGHNLMLFFKKLCYRLLDLPISALSVMNKYTQKFYFDQYFVRIPENRKDGLILYIWAYNTENAEDIYNIDNFTGPFRAIKSEDSTKPFEGDLPTETRKTYFKMIGNQTAVSPIRTPQKSPPKTQSPPKTKSKSKSPSPKTKTKSKSKSPSPKTSTVKHRKIFARF